MVGHQAVGQQPHFLSHHGLGEDSLERGIILVSLIVKDSQACIGAVEGVLNKAALRRSSRSWHVTRITDHAPNATNGS